MGGRDWKKVFTVHRRAFSCIGGIRDGAKGLVTGDAGGFQNLPTVSRAVCRVATAAAAQRGDAGCGDPAYRFARHGKPDSSAGHGNGSG